MWKIGYTLLGDTNVVYSLPYEFSSLDNAKAMMKVLDEHSTIAHYILAPTS